MRLLFQTEDFEFFLDMNVHPYMETITSIIEIRDRVTKCLYAFYMKKGKYPHDVYEDIQEDPVAWADQFKKDPDNLIVVSE